jgi:uncharacterized protein
MRELPLIFFKGNDAAETIGQCDCDCDCACSLPSQGQAAVDLAALTQIEKLRVAEYQSLPLSGEFAICFGPSCKPAVLNQAAISMVAEISGQSFASAQRILAQAYGAPFADDFLSKLVQAGFLTNTRGQNNAPDLLTAWIHVTDRCNLRCEYCYLPHQAEDMEMQTGLEIVQSLISSARDHRYKKIKVKFAGGEPLLQFERVSTWHSHAEKLADAAQLTLDAVVLSNGTLLTTDIARRMKAQGLRLMISLDGLRQAHDTQRKFADGRGSFDLASRGIDIAKAAGLSPHISVTVSARNAPHLPELASWLLMNDLGFNLNFVRSDETSLGIKDQEVLIHSLQQVLKLIKTHPSDKDILNGLVDRVNLSTSRTHACAIERDYVVFDTKGQVARCQMEIYKATPCNGGDPVQAVQNQPNPLNLPISQKTGCDACDWKHWCAGGCPLLQKQSPYCAVYKNIFPEVLQTEGFRLLNQLR